MDRQNLHKITSFAMLLLLVAQIIAPTMIYASEVVDLTETTIATIDSFVKDEETNNLYTEFNTDEAIKLSFDYELNVEDYDFQLNEKQFDLDRGVYTQQGNNKLEIKPLTDQASDISKFNVTTNRGDSELYNSEETLSEDVASEETPSEDIASEETPSEDIASEETPSDSDPTIKNGSTDYKTIPGIPESRITSDPEYVEYNLQDFVMNGVTIGAFGIEVVEGGDSKPDSDGVQSAPDGKPNGVQVVLLDEPQQEDICGGPIDCPEAQVGGMSTNFAVTTDEDFSLQLKVYVRGYKGKKAADSFSISFTGNENPYEFGGAGGGYGINGLTDTLGYVIDYYDNGAGESTGFTSVYTDAYGKMTRGLEVWGQKHGLVGLEDYEIPTNGDYRKFIIDMEYDADLNDLVIETEVYEWNGKVNNANSEYKLLDKNTLHNFNNNTIKFNDGDAYPIKISGSEGGKRSLIRITDLSFQGYAYEYAGLENTTNQVNLIDDGTGTGNKVDTSFVEFGVPQAMEVYATNSSSYPQDITFKDWKTNNYVEEGSDFVEVENGATEVTVSEPLTDGPYTSPTNGNSFKKLKVDMTPVNPATLSEAEQTEYAKDPDWIEATFGSTIEFGTFLTEIPLEITQRITGDDATIDGSDVFYTSMDLSNETAVMEWLLTQPGLDVNDPYAPELEADELYALNDPATGNERLKWSNYTQLGAAGATVTIKVRGLNNVWVEKNVAIAEGDPTDARLVASDTEVNLADAPTSDAEIIDIMNAFAIDYYGDNLTSSIIVKDAGGYNTASPAVGTYEITFAVTGFNGREVTYKATLTVVDDGSTTNSIDILLNTPVYVEINNGQSALDVMNKNILPQVQETIDGVASAPYPMVEADLISDGTYDNTKEGVYVFAFETVGVETGLKVSETATVYVTDDPSSIKAISTIDGQDIEVLKGSFYDETVAAVKHADSYDTVTAVVTESGTVTDEVALDGSNITYSDVDTSVVGDYTTTFKFEDSSSYAEPVSTIRPLNVKVIDSDPATNAVISATDVTVHLSDAPTTDEALKTLMNVQANEANGTDITTSVAVNSLGGYDYSSPAIGTYTIIFTVIGSDGMEVSTTATLTVVADDVVVGDNNIDMLLNSPVVVELNSGQTDAQVVDELIIPYVQETVDGETHSAYAIDSTSLVTNGGYDNTVEGTYTFKLATTGTETGLEVERNALVIVTSDPSALDAYAEIDGKDITVLVDSFYDENAAVDLHADNYDAVTAIVTELGTISDEVALDVTNVIASDVDTSIAGEYTTVFNYANTTDYAVPVSVTKPLTVTVVDSDPSTNAVISGTDAEVEISDAPKTEEDLLALINASASDSDGTDLTDSIIITNLDGYDLDAPAEGDYVISIAVEGSDGVIVSTEVNLTVMADGTATNSIDMLLASPVYVEAGNGLTDSDVVNTLIAPIVIETIDGVDNPAYAINETSLVTNGGYDNAVAGTYMFKFATIGTATGLEVEKSAQVIVTDDMTSIPAMAEIDGKDITVLVGSFYDETVASILQANTYDRVSAVVTESGVVSEVVALEETNVVANDVDTSAAGEYSTTYRFEDETSYAAPVVAQGSYKVTVVDADTSTNAVISATDAEVQLSAAPTSEEDLLALLNAEATDSDGTDLTDSIIITNVDGYDLDAPAEGEYVISIAVEGSDGVIVYTDVNLTVVADGTATNAINMLLTSPVYVEVGNGLTDKDVVNTLITPFVIETIAGTDNTPYALNETALVSNGGYDNTVVGTYIFKLSSVGTETGLEVERNAEVIVTDDMTSIPAMATIDGKDITVLVGSFYDETVAPTLQANTYDTVSAVVSESGIVSEVVALDKMNVFINDVDTSVVGEYSTSYRFVDETSYAAPVVAMGTFGVTVIDSDASTNAVISGTDAEVQLSDAPTTEDELLTLINASANEVDGTDITDSIVISDLGGYDMSTPAEGEYVITIAVEGADGVIVTTEVNLTVLVDGTDTNSIEMLVTSPIVIELNSGETANDVIDNYANAKVIETIAGTANSPYSVDSSTIVTDGGYDNTVAGNYTFKLATVGIETGLEVEKNVKVIVTDDVSSVDDMVVIDGKDITVLVDSAYNNDLATNLHQNNYDVVTAEVTESGVMTPISLTGDDVILSDVDTSIVGDYTTTFTYSSLSATAVEDLEVHVVTADESTNAVISGTDAEVQLSAAPTTEEELLALLNAEAADSDGTDLTDSIIVVDMDGYDIAAPAEGDYVITIAVEGSDGVTVTSEVNLSVVADGTSTNAIDMLLASPVYVEAGNGLADSDVVNTLIMPFVVETIAGVESAPYSVDDTTLVSNGGYDNAVVGTYMFKFAAVGSETGLEVEKNAKVIVTDDMSTIPAMAEIDGKDITVLVGSYYDETVAPILEANTYDKVSAVVTESGIESDVVALDATNIIVSDVDTSVVGEYSTTYKFEDETSYAAPVNTINEFKVTVVDEDITSNAVISATDAEVQLSDAPTSDEELLALLAAEASDSDGTDLTDSIVVVDTDGYDIAAPAEGEYVITIAVEGADGVTVTTEVNLSVVADGTDTNSIDMTLATPVYVEAGNGFDDSTVVDTLIMPYVTETIAGTDSAPYKLDESALVSNGGYDNAVVGTYMFKFSAVGVETGLEVEKNAKVIVTDDPTSIPAMAEIDGKDITVLVGSLYDETVAPTLQASTYDAVSAVVTESGVESDVVALDATNVFANDVDTSVAGVYTTTYRFVDETTYAAPVNTMAEYKVTVVDADPTTNAVISGTDAEVELSDAPTNDEDLLTLLSAIASDSDGTDLTDSIVVVDMDGYDYSTPAEGDYTITIAVEGADGVTVTTEVNLTVVADGTPINAIDMTLATPVYVLAGSGETDADVVNTLIFPYVTETVAGVESAPYKLDETALVSNGGYDNSVVGTYMFKFSSVGTETGLEVEKTAQVIVTDDPTSIPAMATIDGRDIKVLVGSLYNETVAPILQANTYDTVSAVVTESGVESDVVALDATNVFANDVDTSVAGVYTTTYRFVDETSYAAPVNTMAEYKVTVVEEDVSTNAVISATDAEVQLSDAPTSDEELLKVLAAEASDVDGTDITDSIVVVDTEGYDVTAPAEGDYVITIAVKGADGVTVTTEVNLTVVADGTDTSSIEMTLATPVYVLAGSGESDVDVVNNMIMPYITETIAGTDSAPYKLDESALVSNGGYDNAAPGTYMFKLSAVGVETGLEAEKNAKVIVTDDPTSIPAMAEIDGKDITVLVGSYYDETVAPTLEANTYDAVSAVVTESGVESDVVALDATNVFANDVDTSVAGVYTTTYRFVDETSYAAPVNTMNEFAVTVVGEDITTNAVISATDAEVVLSDAPTSNEELLELLAAEASDSDGTDLTDSIVVVDTDGYDVTVPAEGDYTITIAVTGADGVTITTEVNFSVVADGTDTSSIEMTLATPVYVLAGSGESDVDVVNTMIMPYITETIAGTDSAPYKLDESALVSNGGYDNAVVGTYMFKLSAVGVETGLEAEKNAKVIVTDDMSTIPAMAEIDGKDITVLLGSYYDETVAPTLQANTYDTVSAVVTESGVESDVVALDATNVFANDVDTSAAGVYTTTYRFIDETSYAAPVNTINEFTVTVVEEDFNTNAVISATDAEVQLSDAPTSDEELLALLAAEASDSDGTELTDSIVVVDTDGYDVTTPSEGDYTITIAVTGADGVTVTTEVNLTVVADGTATNAIDMLLASPVYVLAGSGESDAAVVNTMIMPYVTETIDGTDSAPYKLDETALVSNGGYDNTAPGTYMFKLSAVGVETGLEVERNAKVIVTDDMSTIPAMAEIDGQDITVLVGSLYDETVAPTLQANTYDAVSAVVTESGVESDVVALDTTNVLANNVDTSVAGEYFTTYRFEDETSYAAKVSAIDEFMVTVVPADPTTNAVISGTDAEVELSDAPTTEEELLAVLNANASEVDGTDITDSIVVVDMDGYDLDAPAEGDFSITIAVTGADGVTVTTEVNLTIVADGTATNAIDMTLATPVYVLAGSGESDVDVVNTLIYPYVVETIDGTDSAPYKLDESALVSNGGYDNKEPGTYMFKFAAVGTETGLEVEKTAKVIVTDDPTSIPAMATIDGKDITVLIGSLYDETVAPTLQANTYDAVSAVVSETGIESDVVALDATNVFANDVDTSAAGVYTTTYRFVDETSYAAPVNTMNEFTVTVVPKDPATNAVITGNDTEVNLSDAPTTEEELLDLIGATATDSDGTDLTDSIVVVDMGGYDLDAPTEGDYVVTISVTGDDGVTVTTDVNFSVVADGTDTNSIEMTLATPVYVLAGSGESDADVVNTKIIPYVTETVADVANAPYALDESALVSNGGYDNKAPGTYMFKFAAVGTETNLEAEKTAKVIVTDDPTSIPAMATIDGKDITVLVGSYYDETVAPTLQANAYETVSAVVSETGIESDVVALDSTNVFANDVDTSAAGVYTTTYRFVDETTYAAPVNTMNKFTVTVVPADPTTNAVITGNDTEVNLSDAPTTEEELLDLIGATATDSDGTDLTDSIVVVDMGGYDLDAPTEGDYVVTISVTGDDGVTVTTDVNFSVVADGTDTNSIEMTLATPVYVLAGSGESDADVVNTKIMPYVTETVADVANTPYALDEAALVSNGGYDNKAPGTYMFKFAAVGTETNLEAEKVAQVIVTDDPTSIPAMAEIDGKDITVLVGSYYDETVAPTLQANAYETVSAVVSELGIESDVVALDSTNVFTNNVDTSVAGVYTTTYRFVDETTYAAPVNTMNEFTVTVVPANPNTNAVISATDTEVNLSDAPTTEEELLDLIDAIATDSDGTDITDSIVIVDMDGYDLSAPTEGDYTITIAVTGEDGVTVTTDVNFSVVADGTPTNAIDMLLTSPVYVEVGNGLTDVDVVNTLITPFVVETINEETNSAYSVDEASLVTNGGYDNNTVGTYVFKFAAVGTETGLEVERNANVIVTEDITNAPAVAEIDGKDIVLPLNTNFDEYYSPIYNANNYDTVEGVVTSYGEITEEISLDESNIINIDVNTNVIGTYNVTYYFESENTYAPAIRGVEGNTVNAVRTFDVKVIDPVEALEQLDIVKTVSDDDGLATPGETLTYSIKVTNLSDDLIFDGVKVVDSFDSQYLNGDNVSNIQMIDEEGNKIGGSGHIVTEEIGASFGTMLPGETKILEFDILLPQDLTDGDTIDNIATVSIDGAEKQSNNSSIKISNDKGLTDMEVDGDSEIDGNVGNTGSATMIIVLGLSLILIVLVTLKRRTN